MENKTANQKHGKKPLDKKQVAIAAGGTVGALVIIGFCVWFFWLRGYLAAKDASPVYVNSVASIAGIYLDTNPRYSGLVEPQQITKINKDESRTVDQVLVSEGDTVNVGDALFAYDTEEMNLSIQQAELDLEGITNNITTLQDQKKTLEDEKKKASSDEQYSYTVQIQSVEHQINSEQYNKSVKQNELEKLKDSLENAEVYSEVAGIVKEINITPKTDSSGQPSPFMSILSSGDFRIKGIISEMNAGSIAEGQAVTVRSRVDPNATWPGTISSIVFEPIQNNNYYGGMDSGEQSSKYNFYVTLSSLDGLILGQHVYIEPSTGAAARAGIWLPAAYVVSDDSGSYVWARDAEEKLEKRAIMLGTYDQQEDLYEIVSGLEASDFIAYPGEDLVPGGPTTTDASAQVLPDDAMNSVEPGLDDGMVDPGMVDPGLTDPGAVDPGLDGTVTPEGGEDAAGLYESGLTDESQGEDSGAGGTPEAGTEEILP